MKKILAAVGVIGIGVALFLTFSGSEAATPAASSPAKLQAAGFVEQYRATPDAVLLDVRTPGEFNEGHIASATNINFGSASFAAEIGKLDASKTYFVYCRSGNRSAQAITVMRAAGIQNIVELQGGIVAHANTLTLVSGASSR